MYKTFKLKVENIKPSGFGQDQGALDTMYTIRNVLAKQYASATYIKNNSSIFTTEQVTDANVVQPRVGKLIAEYTGAILVYERFINGSGPVQSTQASSEVTDSGANNTSQSDLRPGSLTGKATRAD